MDIAAVVQFGLGGTLLVLLFLGLRSGSLHTNRSVELLLAEKEVRLTEKDERIAKLEELVAKLDERNDVLSQTMTHTLEVSRTQGMIAALPTAVAERVVQ
jgi:hypothetical protein